MTSIADEIDRLAAQRDAGRLSKAEFEAAKARVVGGGPASTPLGALRRSSTDRWIGGVCGGLAAYAGVESWLVRLMFALALVFGGAGFVPYLLLWIFVPAEGR